MHLSLGRARFWIVAAAVTAVVMLRTDVARAGFEFWSPGGPEGGEIRAVTIAPTTPKIVYAASDPSTLFVATPLGVFRSTNAALSWSLATSGKSVDGGATWSPMRAGLSNPPLVLH